MSASESPSPACWILTDGAAGNERQALALARAMQVPAESLRIGLRGPWAWFAPRMTVGLRICVDADLRRRLREPWPALAIGCGRDGATLMRWLRTASGGKTFTVQILDPRIDPQHFDLVVAPRHDGLTGANVIQTIGALNPVDEDWLGDGLARFPTLAQLPQPRMAVLIGGPRRGLDMDDAWFDVFLARINALVARDGGSLMVSTSRRTPAAWRRASRERLHADCVHFWNGPEDGENPYPGYLAAADRIVVTPDSVNMLSEASATGKPLFSLLPDSARGKLTDLHAELRAQGWLHPLDANVDLSTLPQLPPLRELAAIATKVWHVLESTRSDVVAALTGD
ncbi:MAG TPA: mitochondrial fission ELM1 family protein [Rudaea sp.]|nr:mitochondrial fission ELM1 family protein [Rudaea sp.]